MRYNPKKEGSPKEKLVFACEYELSVMFRVTAGAKNSLRNKSEHQSQGRSALQQMAESGLDRELEEMVMAKVRIN